MNPRRISHSLILPLVSNGKVLSLPFASEEFIRTGTLDSWHSTGEKLEFTTLVPLPLLLLPLWPPLSLVPS